MTASVRCTVQVCESVLRDGIQGWPEILSTADKRRLVRAIVAARFTELDVTSFVPAAVVPQFADATEVLSAVPAGARTRVLTVNMKGVARVVEAHRLVRNIDTCGVPFSASEPHNIANLRRTHAEHKVVVEQMVDALHGADITPLVAIATAYGCPIRGPVTDNGGVTRPGYNRQQDNPNDGQARWNLISRNGQDVVSGIYIFTVESGQGTQRGHFVIIR